MPEIAEVERARTILEQILKNQTILDVEAVVAFLTSANPSLMIPSSSKIPRQKNSQPPSKGKK